MTASPEKFSRRAALAGAIAVAATPAAASALATDSLPTPAPGLRFVAGDASLVDDLRQRWASAAERAAGAGAASESTLARLFADHFPDALLLRQGDDSELKSLVHEFGEYAPGKDGPSVFGLRAIEEICRLRGEGRTPWRPALADADIPAALQRARARRRELLQAFDQWQFDKHAADAASGHAAACAESDAAWADVFAIERDISGLPASGAALALKLKSFAFLRQMTVVESGDSAAGQAERLIEDDSPCVLSAVRLAIDLADLAAAPFAGLAS